MTAELKNDATDNAYPDLQTALESLDEAKDRWAQTSIKQRIAVLTAIKDCLLDVAEPWAVAATREKQLPADSPLAGEEWLSGPYALMEACNGLISTLQGMDDKAYLRHLPVRQLENGQIAVQVTPHSVWDRLLLSGVKAEVWMQPGVSRANLAEHAASAYNTPAETRRGKVALVLGAGNIAAIAPLDVFQKLFLENQVVLLKMNPVNDYLAEFIEAALQPLVRMDALRVVKGGGSIGAWLTSHDLVEEIHITGAQATHDVIVWGVGEEGRQNKAAGTPKLKKRITSELGAVCPTIVVPGNWSQADIAFQAEHIATQKLHNSGFNCVACQALIMPAGWDQGTALLAAVSKEMGQSFRQAYYPGAEGRLQEFADHAKQVTSVPRGDAPAVLINQLADDEWFCRNEVFAPALSTETLAAPDAETYLINAIRFANEKLRGTLGANIIIHPNTIKAMGRGRFEEIITELRYGTIAVNAWTGLGFLLAGCPWGAFPGHTLEDAQSGIGTVHNTFMLEQTERTVVEAPFRPFPRSLAAGSATLLPRPPWFVTNRRQHVVGRLLTHFSYKPSWLKLPRIFINALLG